jgi:uncharacterized protein (TIGR03382 family)
MRRGLFATLLLATFACCVIPTRAWAKANGISVPGCDGCHKGGRQPTVSITSEPMAPDPGSMATLTVHVSKTNGPVAGFYLTTNKSGTLSAPGAGVKLVSPSEATHTSPSSSGTADEVQFVMHWAVPAGRGSANFDVYAVSANGNNSSNGDGAGAGRLSVTYGCPGVAAFVDHDGDGFGRDFDPTRVCEIGPGYSAKGGDCDDNNAEIFPGHKEVCNFADDNCDGQVNEGMPLVLVYRDADGDGYGAKTTTDTQMRCGTMGGYSVTHDDCNDEDRDIHPGAAEMCDGIDNDCNGRVDDGARATCGTGWCRRSASSCASTSCTPGAPRAEMCNNFDDDCDGVIDNGPDLCGPGKVCFGGYCLSPSEAGDAAAFATAHPEPPPDGGMGADGPASTGGSNAPGNNSDTPPSGGTTGGAPAGPGRRPTAGCSVAEGAGMASPLALLPLMALALRRRRR